MPNIKTFEEDYHRLQWQSVASFENGFQFVKINERNLKNHSTNRNGTRFDNFILNWMLPNNFMWNLVKYQTINEEMRLPSFSIFVALLNFCDITTTSFLSISLRLGLNVFLEDIFLSISLIFPTWLESYAISGRKSQSKLTLWSSSCLSSTFNYFCKVYLKNSCLCFLPKPINFHYFHPFMKELCMLLHN